MNNPVKNEDIELWREVKDDYYSPSIHVTKDGLIGIQVGGRVIIATVSEWHGIGCNAWSSMQSNKNMHWTAGIVRRFEQLSVVRFILSLWHNLSSRQ